tara:strand:- start:79 stop:582 length:504 start_codon:yes stop_codon:yes gene_type:complete
MNNNFSKQLYQFPGIIKLIIFVVIVNITCGVGVGLFYVANTTNLSVIGTTEQFKGSDVNNEFEIPEKYPKPLSELLMTTHNHLISLTFIFLIIGSVFYFSSIFPENVKSILIIEPFVSILTTFAGIWLISFGYPIFVYLVLPSGILMYLCFFLMAVSILYELALKNN